MSPNTSPVRRRVGRRRALAGLFAAAAMTAAGVAVVVTMPQANAGSIPANTQFYIDPNSQVNRWVTANPNDSRRPLIQQRIASQPQGIWFANYRPNTVTADVQAITGPAASQGRTPVLVAYMLPNRDCGGASAGGAPNIPEYNTWVQRFAAGLGSSRVIVILEPDSIALITCLDSNALSQRYSALGQAARTIKSANPQAKVYFDGGHSGWNSAGEQANRLRSAGVANGDGVYTNVSNFHFTDRERTFVKSILSNLGNGNLRGVIDTSRNGRGALGSEWCDPAGRGIGANPTADTFDAQIDAYLWVKPPGEADGCATTAGTFLPELAYTLAQNGVPVTTGPTTPPTSPTSNLPPGSPTNLRTTQVTSTSVSLAWNAAQSNGRALSNYTIRWSGAASGSVTVPATQTTATVSNLATNATYTFTAVATNDLGQVSQPSNAVTATTTTTTTTPPTTSTGGGACRVSYVKQSEWSGGFVVQVRVTNTGTGTINGWSLAWTFGNGQRITSQWNANINPTTGSVTATNVDWNANLGPNSTADFGFQGTWSGSNPVPTSFTLNGSPCTIAIP